MASRGFDRGQPFLRPVYEFQGRITADGSSGHRAEPGRYHLYLAWGCPWAQRTAIVRKLMGLEDVVSLWPTLARFDLGYNPLGKISERRLVDFPSLWGYARDLYHLPAFRETTDFGAFARFGSGPSPGFLNDGPWRIKVDPYRADWDEPHDREQLG